MMPHCWNRASTSVSVAASAPVCEAAARAPAADRPALTATIGLRRETSRAMRMNRRGFPKLSTYIRITPVRGSSAQYSMRSLVETSALLPTETNWDMLTFRPRAYARIASPSAPLWLENAIGPGAGNAGEKVALRRTSPSVFATPMQLGPIIRAPAARTRSRSAVSRARPAGSISPKPAVMTTMAGTAFARHASTAPSTHAAGTAITARSTAPGTSAIEL